MILQMSMYYPDSTNMRGGGGALFLSFLSQGQAPQFLSRHAWVSGESKCSHSREWEQDTGLVLGSGEGEDAVH